MKEHDHHLDCATVLHREAQAAGLTDMASDIAHYITVHHRGVAAHGTGDKAKKWQATMALGAASALVGMHFLQASAHPKVMDAAEATLAALCDAVKASI